MNMKVCITGANRGLGLELVRQLISTNQYIVCFALCRRASPDLNTLASNSKCIKIVEGIDVVDPMVGTRIQTALAETKLDLLIHNAGAYGPSLGNHVDDLYASQTLANINAERMMYSFQLNTVAPLLITQSLSANNLNPKSKVIIIGSLMGSIADNESGGHYGYRAAKAAVNQVAKSLSVDLKEAKVAVGVVHPGFVHTGFGGINAPLRPGQRNVVESVKGVLEAIDGINLETTGRFWHGNYGEGVKELNW